MFTGVRVAVAVPENVGVGVIVNAVPVIVGEGLIVVAVRVGVADGGSSEGGGVGEGLSASSGVAVGFPSVGGRSGVLLASGAFSRGEVGVNSP